MSDRVTIPLDLPPGQYVPEDETLRRLRMPTLADRKIRARVDNPRPHATGRVLTHKDRADMIAFYQPHVKGHGLRDTAKQFGVSVGKVLKVVRAGA